MFREQETNTATPAGGPQRRERTRPRKECTVLLVGHNAEPDMVDLLERLEILDEIAWLCIIRSVNVLLADGTLIKIYVHRRKFTEVFGLAIRLDVLCELLASIGPVEDIKIFKAIAQGVPVVRSAIDSRSTSTVYLLYHLLLAKNHIGNAAAPYCEQFPLCGISHLSILAKYQHFHTKTYLSQHIN
ncbi:hypothetical protein B0H14DRAFT_2601345 [Mycena olivaceomarginata]|nr:hypothetical protein B0H14DRAFT_2601345 [Mycena olivaceomarginata]